MSRTIVLAGAVRTAIGKMGGALSTTPAATLGSIVIKEALHGLSLFLDGQTHIIQGVLGAGDVYTVGIFKNFPKFKGEAFRSEV